jgi:DNA-binding MarR family transcriptional regulator
MPEDCSLNLWISILHRYRKTYVSKRLEAYGAASGLYMFIIVLAEHNGASQEQIADLLKIDKATVARSVQKLLNENYLRRQEDEQDKRAYQIYLMPKAKEIIPKIQSAINDWNRMVINGIPKDSKEILLRCLQQMSENAYKIYTENEIS